MAAISPSALITDESDVERRGGAVLVVVPTPAPPAPAPPPPRFPLELAELWTRLLDGICFVSGCQFWEDRCYFQLTFRSGPRFPVSERSRQIMERVLLGESQKVVAFDLAIAASAASLACGLGMSAIGFERRAMFSPIPLVMIAHAAQGYALPRAQVHAASDLTGAWNLSVERPDLVLPEGLSPAEQAIVRHVVEGRTCPEIAKLRGAALSTVANQLASTFHKLGVSGRGQLRAELVKYQARGERWPCRFEQPPVAEDAAPPGALSAPRARPSTGHQLAPRT